MSPGSLADHALSAYDSPLAAYAAVRDESKNEAGAAACTIDEHGRLIVQFDLIDLTAPEARDVLATGGARRTEPGRPGGEQRAIDEAMRLVKQSFMRARSQSARAGAAADFDRSWWD